MEYKVVTLMPSLGSDTAGCSTFCSTKRAVLDEVRSSLEHLRPGESITVEREIPEAFCPGTSLGEYFAD